MTSSRILIAVLLTALPAVAHDAPVVQTVVTIDSRTIATKLEPSAVKRAAKVAATERLIAESIAAELNGHFAFLKWAPSHLRIPAEAKLQVTIEEKPQPNGRSTYYLRYQRVIFAPEVREKTRTLDYGGADPLYKAHEEKPLGSSAKLAASVAKKVASHFNLKRQLVLEQFLSQVPLCRRGPKAEDGHTFLVHLPLEPMKAHSNSVLQVSFTAKPEQGQRKGKTGELKLSPLRLCDECEEVATRGSFAHFFFPGIGDLNKDAWDDRILNILDATKLDKTIVYMARYWSVDNPPPFQEMD